MDNNNNIINNNNNNNINNNNNNNNNKLIHMLNSNRQCSICLTCNHSSNKVYSIN